MATIQEALSLALDHHLAGRAAEAEQVYAAILDAVPDHPDTLHLFGLLRAQTGRLEEAVALLERAVAERPGHPEFRVNLGKAYRAAGRPDEAAVAYREALRLCPEAPEVAFVLASLERDLGRLPAAIAGFLHTATLQPDLAEAWLQAGALLRQTGHGAEAVRCLRHAVRLRPDHAPAWHQLGVALQRVGDAESVAVLRQATVLDPLDPGIRLNAARALCDGGHWGEAARQLAASLALDPTSVEALDLLGFVRWRQRGTADPSPWYRRALRLDPERPNRWTAFAIAAAERGERAVAALAAERALSLDPAGPQQMGLRALLHRDAHRLDDALRLHDRAVAAAPAAAEQRWNRGLTRLLAGRYREGWEDYEARWRTAGFPTKPRGFTQPLWSGESIAGRTILLHEEQGRGDAIQFIRYAPLVAARGARVVVETGADLAALLGTVDGISQLVVSGEPLPPFDLHCPLLSLPRAFGHELPDIPARVPYLQPDPRQVIHWAERLATADAGGTPLRVGLVWAGNPGFAGDRERSPGLEVLRPLFTVPGCRFLGLQVGAGRLALLGEAMPASFTDLGAELASFTDTAAVMAGLDLVVSSCTAPAHLAGALGRPVWVMLSHTPDWRWLLGRDDSPWYPTARLFRQPAPGDWASVVAMMRDALEAMVRGRL